MFFYSYVAIVLFLFLDPFHMPIEIIINIFAPITCIKRPKKQLMIILLRAFSKKILILFLFLFLTIWIIKIIRNTQFIFIFWIANLYLMKTIILFIFILLKYLTIFFRKSKFIFHFLFLDNFFVIFITFLQYFFKYIFLYLKLIFTCKHIPIMQLKMIHVKSFEKGFK